MEQMLDIVRKRDIEKIIELLEKNNKYEVLSEFAEVLNKRAYLTIDCEGNLIRKNLNMVLPIFAYFDDRITLGKTLLEGANLKERERLEKIERFSSKDLEKVKENFIKTLFNGNYEFAKKYGKELLLRDSQEFFKIVSNFALIGECTSLKPLMVLSFKKIMEDYKYDERIFYIFISYMCKYRDDTRVYERAEKEVELEQLRDRVLRDRKILYSKEGLGILTSLELIKTLAPTNYKKVLAKLESEIPNKTTLLESEELALLEVFL